MISPSDTCPDLPWLTVEPRTEGDTVRVQISGELDLATHELLDAALSGEAVQQAAVVELDLSELVFCDSRGLSRLLAFVREVRQSGRDVRVENAGFALRRMFGWFGAEDVLHAS
ncbi:MAG: STAS domain-containing protein [Nocardioidaceae bacterium]